ncbi:hypothetical protein [Agrilactobacillus composti]|uniref:hypothetical protein n=1 Tax=Agrilactobacillus composti TaxID=398555 RepID=UPI0005526DC5|nr:hypothetical protein [Agrilactobacillus composti]
MKKQRGWLFIIAFIGLLSVCFTKPTPVKAYSDPYVDYQVQDDLGLLSQSDIDRIHDINADFLKASYFDPYNQNYQIFVYTFAKKPQEGFTDISDHLSSELPYVVLNGDSDKLLTGELPLDDTGRHAVMNPKTGENLFGPQIMFIYVFPTHGHFEIRIDSNGAIFDFQEWYLFGRLSNTDTSASNLMKWVDRTKTFTQKSYINQGANSEYNWDFINSAKNWMIFVWIIIILIKFLIRNKDDSSSAGPGPNEHYDDGFFEGYVIGQIMDKNNNSNGLGGGL